ncbi:hypothetical protein NX801_24045 [Streptomyces sp. LP05-1]|uniref:vWA-MoxR associated protein middle region 2 domain-containing protein n=1 Tax=Streptomyces pyxinae TaxID=2970734 RepID=A0ABT2CMY5_9ACTN|nr:hypothetical protein [Streptomyces sp. LP05-1]MCS0638670.1 hypothetical protein [Streptomyces sp. LP05-1]
MTRGPRAGAPRHVLVVASQCDSQQYLKDLDTVAGELYEVLTDPALGACQESPVAGAELVRSGRAGRDTVDTAVRAAIHAAGRQHAVLVLAFVGHGQSPEGSNRLYYLAEATGEEDAAGSVDVNSLVTAAANQDGIAGVVLLLDTCQAAAGLPGLDALVGGYAKGRTRVTALAAAPAQQSAFELDFGRTLTRLIRHGFPGEGEVVPLRAYREALMSELSDQDAAWLDYDGSVTADEGLWLAHNARGPRWTAGLELGELGACDLRAALDSWPGGGLSGAAVTEPLRALRDRAAADPGRGAPRVREVADALLVVADTERALFDWAGSALTTYVIQRAVAALNAGQQGGREPFHPPPELAGRELLRHLLEFTALHAPRLHGRNVRHAAASALAPCLIALAHACGLDCADARADRWAEAAGALPALGDARRQLAAWHGDRRISLIVSLHAARVDWPDSISVWLRDGDGCSHGEVFECVPSQAGVEAVLPEILYWAEDRLPPGARLLQVDVVVPAALLPAWRPEEAEAGLYRLGVDRTVTLRWADRLFVPRHLRGINDRAREQLEKAENQVPVDGEAPVDWLDAEATREPKRLKELCRDGGFNRAIGIGHRPADLVELVQLLLPYTPVLLWPGDESGPAARTQVALGRHWAGLPGKFTAAYLARLRAAAGRPAAGPPEAVTPGAGPPDTGAPAAGPLGSEGSAAGPSGAEVTVHETVHEDDFASLAGVRSAWHDLPWLDVCGWFGRSGGHTETTSTRSVR